METISLRKPMLVVLLLVLTACAPVLNGTYMREGRRDASFEELREHPGRGKGILFILGGIIVRTKFTEAGSQLEAVHVPVDGQGYFLEKGRSEGRFLAMLPRDRKTLDPLVFRRGRRVTLAGEFVGTRQGRIDEMEYTYPVFEIRQIYLWPREYYSAPPYYYDPWFYPYPYYYWEPWWSFYYYSAPVPQPSSPRLLPPPQPPPPPQHHRRDRDDERERR